MMSPDTLNDVRSSRKKMCANPIWASQQAFQTGIGRRDQEQRQLSLLQRLQADGVPLFCIPKMIRVDPSSLMISTQRIGVVGLVVDAQRVGYVTRLQVQPSRDWAIADNLPFRLIHIQSLLRLLLDASVSRDGLPELLAFHIRDTLGERYEGDSMDVACLLALAGACASPQHDLLGAAAAVVSPAADGRLQPAQSVTEKLTAFQREFDRGSLLVRHPNDRTAAAWDHCFDQVWEVGTFFQLAGRLHANGLLDGLLNRVPLRAQHAAAIESQFQSLLANESRFPAAAHFLSRLQRRIGQPTPLRVQLAISYAEEDLHRHRGNFAAAIEVRRQRVDLERHPLIASYQRLAESDNRHAADLYDAHRFDTAIDCLIPWLEKFQNEPPICLPETRAFLFNTLARCWVLVGDPRWESLHEQALEIQQMVDPCNIPVTTNYLAHGYLKERRWADALRVLGNGAEIQMDPYRVWLNAECARQANETWGSAQCAAFKNFAPTHHAYGFICQAVARQSGHAPQTRLKLLEAAQACFAHGVEHDGTNVKRVLGACCQLAIAVTRDDPHTISQAINHFRQLTQQDGFEAIRTWYQPVFANVVQRQDWPCVDALFARVPHW